MMKAFIGNRELENIWKNFNVPDIFFIKKKEFYNLYEKKKENAIIKFADIYRN